MKNTDSFEDGDNIETNIGFEVENISPEFEGKKSTASTNTSGKRE